MFYFFSVVFTAVIGECFRNKRMLLVVAENGRNLLDVVFYLQNDKPVAGYCLREQVNNSVRRRLQVALVAKRLLFFFKT